MSQTWKLSGALARLSHSNLSASEAATIADGDILNDTSSKDDEMERGKARLLKNFEKAITQAREMVRQAQEEVQRLRHNKPPALLAALDYLTNQIDETEEVIARAEGMVNGINLLPFGDNTMSVPKDDAIEPKEVKSQTKELTGAITQVQSFTG